MLSLDVLLVGMESQIRYRRGCCTRLNQISGILLLEPDSDYLENYIYVCSWRMLDSLPKAPPASVWLLCSEADSLPVPGDSFRRECENLLLFSLPTASLLNSLSIRLHQYSRWRHQLGATNDLQALADLAARASGCPVAIVDSFFQVKAISGAANPKTYIFRELSENALISGSNAQYMFSSEHAAFPMEKLDFPFENAVISDNLIRFEGKSIARILVERPPSPESTVTTQYIDDFINVVRPLIHASNELEKLSMSSISTLIADLIELRITDPEEMERRRMLSPDLVKGKFYHPVVIKFHRTSLPIPYHFISGQLSQIFLRSSVSSYDNGLVVIAAKNNRDAELVYDRERLTELLERYDAFAGIGGCTAFLASLRPLYIQCAAAVRLGRTFCAQPDQRIFNFNDYRMYFYVDLAIEAAVRQHNFLNISYLCAPGILNILRHDRIHGKQLYETLCSYLNCDCNATLCAQQMNVHRNTITYRVAMVEKMLCGSLSDVKFRQSIIFSVYVIDYEIKYLHCEPLDSGGKFTLDVDWNSYRSFTEQS